MQPYFLPYGGYFALIAACDAWVVFDDAQMIRHGWVDRNRILHPNEGWQYIKVPVAKHPRSAPIREVQPRLGSDWRQRIIRQLQHYRRAPCSEELLPWLGEALEAAQGDLAAVNISLLRAVCDRLKIPFRPLLHSELSYDRSRVRGPGDWAVVVAEHLGASAYLNPVGGLSLFSPTDFEAVDCRLELLRWRSPVYAQGTRPFEAGLSIVDMLLWEPSLDGQALLRGAEILSVGEARALVSADESPLEVADP